jgi:hypothetical protein
MRRPRRADPRTRKRIFPVRRASGEQVEAAEDTMGNMTLPDPVAPREPSTDVSASIDTERDTP